MTEPSRALFLSYASQDVEAARRICEVLRGAGIEVWFDQSELRGGDVWDQKIRRQIRECALFVPVISANTASRREGYFRLEWDLADQRTHMLARDRAFIVPVCLDGTPDSGTDAPESFLRVQWTRLPDGDTPPVFAERVSRLLSTEPAHAPAEVKSPVAPAPHTAAAPRQLVPSAAASRQMQRALLVIATIAVIGLGYLTLDKFVLSKRIAGTGQASAPTTQPAPRIETAISEKSIAVLPFVDLSEKKDQEYFADGMAEEVLDLLANVPGIRVISRTSSFQFKGKSQDLRTIGDALGAAYVVEGSVRRSGERLRVTAKLFNTRDGSHLWSENYDEGVAEALKVQGRIATSLVRALQVTVGAADFGVRPALASAEAYDLYLRGRHAFDRSDREGFEAAVGYFQQELELDPSAGRTAAWLALTQALSTEFGYAPPREGYERARQTAQHALTLDPQSSLAYVTLAKVHLIYEWDWAAAERDAKEALRLDPRDPIAIGTLGQVTAALARWDDSTRLYSQAFALDPLTSGWLDVLGNIRYRTGRLTEAEALIRKMLDLSPTYGGGHSYLGQILLAQGKFDAALSEMELESPDSGRDTGLAIVYSAMGRRAESDAALARLTKERASDTAYEIAEAHAYRSELDQAFTWLERAYRQKDVELFWIKGDPLLRNLEHDSRYSAFLRKMNLPVRDDVAD